MMHDLSKIQAELSDVVERLSELDSIFALALDLFPDELSKDWQIQARWITDELRGVVWSQYDELRGIRCNLAQLQTQLSAREAA